MAFAKVILALVLLSSAALTTVQGFRVLGLFPFNGRSHHVMFKALMEVLADRGHEVVMVSTFPQKQPYANYTDLDLSKHFPSLVNTFNFDHVTSFKRAEVIRTIGMEWAGADLCRRVFKTREFQDLMAGEYGQFDVVLTEVFGSDCWAVVPYKMQVPNVGVVTTPDLAWMHERMGSVDNPSFLPVSNQPYAGKLNLWHRLQNVYAYVISKVLHKWYIEDPTDVMLREIFGADTPLSVDLVRNTSLLLLNCHPSVNPARPVPPNVVFAGGLHLKNTRPDRTGSFLAPDLRAWMDGAEHGVILFSLGSLVQSSTLPRDAIDGLLQAFADLPQRVLWKYEKEDLVLPPNVRTAAWVPQSDVLAHPKTILFITHGGLMGTTEALFLGVPMLGIPLFGDQVANMAQYKELGIAERLDHADLTKDNVLTVVRKMTATDSYHARSSMVATRFSDRPRSAGAEAAWWIEYVVRHQGAPHLRPLGADLPLYQYLLLDVVAIFLAGVVTMLVLARFLLMKFILKITKGSKAKQH